MLNKLARTFAAQVEALKRYRSAGEQTIKVQHVTVNDGGQAIVGNVSQGAGVSPKPEDQPDAKAITDAREPTMRSTFAEERVAVPVTRDEKR